MLSIQILITHVLISKVSFCFIRSSGKRISIVSSGAERGIEFADCDVPGGGPLSSTNDKTTTEQVGINFLFRKYPNPLFQPSGVLETRENFDACNKNKVFTVFSNSWVFR